MERPNLGSSEEILRALVRMLNESYKGDKLLYERDVFRYIMKYLNREGGTVILNALGPAELDAFLGRVSAAAKDEHGKAQST